MIKEFLLILITSISFPSHSFNNNFRNQFFEKESVAITYGETLYLSQACKIPHYQETILKNKNLFESIYKIQVPDNMRNNFNIVQNQAFNQMRKKFESSTEANQEIICIQFNSFLTNHFQNSLDEMKKKNIN